MRIYSVESKNLFFVNFLDFKIRVFSPRELFYSLIGIWMLVSAIKETISPIIGLLGMALLVFGYMPYKFLPFEVQLLNLLRFHLSHHHTSRKIKKEPSDFLGLGEMVTIPETAKDESTIGHQQKQQGPQTIRIPNLEEPYTITLKTNTKKKFLPASIYVDDILVSNTTTNRRGDISCSMLIDTYGSKRFCAKDESDNILYDQTVEFVP